MSLILEYQLDENNIIAANSHKENFIEIRTTGAGSIDETANLQIWDTNVEGSAPGSPGLPENACRFNLNLTLKGDGVKKLSPPKVNLGL